MRKCLDTLFFYYKEFDINVFKSFKDVLCNDVYANNLYKTLSMSSMLCFY